LPALYKRKRSRRKRKNNCALFHERRKRKRSEGRVEEGRGERELKSVFLGR